MALPPLIWERVVNAGAQASGASQSRFMLTTGNRTVHVKFSFANAGEAQHAPANELLANRLLQMLNVDRPVLAIVEVPQAIAAGMPGLPALGSHLAFGVEQMSGATDVQGPLVLATAAGTSADVVLQQFAVLTWLQNGDHAGHNFMEHNGSLVVIDFAASPADGVWTGAALGGTRADHGGLTAYVRGLNAATRQAAKRRFLAVDRAAVVSVMNEVPDSWASPVERSHIVDELLRTQLSVANDCF